MTATSGSPRIDPVTFEVIAASLLSTAAEMGGCYKRSSYSPMIRDMEDFSCALFTSDGDLVAQADYIPAQLGAMSLVVKSVIARWGERVGDGDAYISNHPYMGAMHLSDINIVMPVFADGEFTGWSGTAAHHIDVGGVNPGSEGPELEDLHGEGLVLPPIRISIAGVENEDLVDLITQNIRDPLSTVSDLRAQRAACALGRDRLRELVGRHGAPTIQEVMARLLDLAEQGVSTALLALPDGRGEAFGFLDDDGKDGPTYASASSSRRAATASPSTCPGRTRRPLAR